MNCLIINCYFENFNNKFLKNNKINNKKHFIISLLFDI